MLLYFTETYMNIMGVQINVVFLRRSLNPTRCSAGSSANISNLLAAKVQVRWLRNLVSSLLWLSRLNKISLGLNSSLMLGRRGRKTPEPIGNAEVITGLDQVQLLVEDPACCCSAEGDFALQSCCNYAHFLNVGSTKTSTVNTPSFHTGWVEISDDTLLSPLGQKVSVYNMFVGGAMGLFSERLETTGLLCISVLTSCCSQRGCQTKALQAAEAAVQSVWSTDSGTQTEPQHAAAAAAEQLQHSGLKEFLQRVEDDVVQQLASRDRSHAFDGFNVNWEDRVDGVSKTSEPPSVESQCGPPSVDLPVWTSFVCQGCCGLGCCVFAGVVPALPAVARCCRERPACDCSVLGLHWTPRRLRLRPVCCPHYASL